LSYFSRMHFEFSHLAILGLVAFTFLHRESRTIAFQRTFEDWILDILSLLNHFLLLPLIQGSLVYWLYSSAIPHLKGSLEMGWITALGASMLIDYAWYWNHRAFHAQTKFWNLHAVHHAPKELDVFASSRNSLISPIFMVYMWIIPLVIFLAKDPVPFLTFSGISLIINFWGHTHFNTPRNSFLQRSMSFIFIQPEDHFWHHSTDNSYCNFGTVFNFWDKIHGTWNQPKRAPSQLGFDHDLPLWRKLFFPWEK
jgi:alkylglycerol monooxygenase